MVALQDPDGITWGRTPEVQHLCAGAREAQHAVGVEHIDALEGVAHKVQPRNLRLLRTPQADLVPEALALRCQIPPLNDALAHFAREEDHVEVQLELHCSLDVLHPVDEPAATPILGLAVQQVAIALVLLPGRVIREGVCTKTLLRIALGQEDASGAERFVLAAPHKAVPLDDEVPGEADDALRRLFAHKALEDFVHAATGHRGILVLRPHRGSALPNGVCLHAGRGVPQHQGRLLDGCEHHRPVRAHVFVRKLQRQAVRLYGREDNIAVAPEPLGNVCERHTPQPHGLQHEAAVGAQCLRREL
mmetsp:Transcript_20080/g.55286  ORF Transcript_20080/g.55286 Transcript_20080/m.55286 type:complete len:304 (-) Transcript_20080:269-1180(-)